MASYLDEHGHYEIVDVLGGGWMILIDGIQWGMKRDRSGAGSVVFPTKREAIRKAEELMGASRNPKRRSNPRGETGWRSYGPGKYNSIVDSYVHALDMEGWGSEEIGDVADFGWYGLMGPAEAGFLMDPDAVPRIAKEEKDRLTPEEMRELKETVGVIIEENDQGFVGIAYYKSAKALKKAWEKIAEDAEEFYEQQEEAEEGA